MGHVPTGPQSYTCWHLGIQNQAQATSLLPTQAGSGHPGAGSKGSRPSDSGEDLKSTNEVPGGQLWAKSHFVKGKWGSVQGAHLQVLAGPPWLPSLSSCPRDGPGSSTTSRFHCPVDLIRVYCSADLGHGCFPFTVSFTPSSAPPCGQEKRVP